MTAPLNPPPPPHERSAQDAWPPPGAGSGGHGSRAPGSQHAEYAEYPAYSGHGWYGQDGPGMKTEVREACVVALAVALGGVLLGVLWWWLAPHVPLIGDVVEGKWIVYLKDTEGEQAVGVDGTFSLLGLAFGVVSALVVFLLRRRGGVPLVVGLAVGGLLGSLLAWRVGVWLGPAEDVVARARDLGRGVTFSAPLKLGAKGALLAWPLAALLLHLGLMALFGPRDPEPELGHGPYEAPPAA
ncbi:AAA family ATPase [Streptomyces sp. NPDC050416]|uniref:AAA family ATPase n=1 Tax=Streptomyces sp. NPDC050416 TaxID=3365611 RepID=UPI003795D926